MEIDPGSVREPYVAWVRAAAARAKETYPGPVGDVLARELRAYAQFGHRFGGDALLHRLATDILASAQDADGAFRPVVA